VAPKLGVSWELGIWELGFPRVRGIAWDLGIGIWAFPPGGRRGENPKSQGPNSKEYLNPKSQKNGDGLPSGRRRLEASLGFCDLKFAWDLGIGIWAFPLMRAPARPDQETRGKLCQVRPGARGVVGWCCLP